MLMPSTPKTPRLPSEDAVKRAVSAADPRVARKLWAAYDGWAFAPESERRWLADTVRRLVGSGVSRRMSAQ